jgi:hypothetical protein
MGLFRMAPKGTVKHVISEFFLRSVEPTWLYLVLLDAPGPGK